MKSIWILLLLTPLAARADFHRFEVRTAPIAFLVRWFTLETAFRPSEQWAVGPTFTRYAENSNFILGGRVGNAFGLFGTYYFRPVPADGAYLTLRWQRERYTNYPGSEASRQIVEDRKGGTFTLTGGYRPSLSNVLFAMVGGGLQRQRFDVVKSDLTRENGRVTWTPYVEAKLGAEF